MTLGLEPLRRIASYAVCTDGSERVLLVRGSASSGTPGAWSLPGGAVGHGEHPADTVVRETAAETGLSVAAGSLRDVLTDVRDLRHRGMTIHTDRLVYDVGLRGGSLIERTGQPTDLARWVTLTEAKLLPLRPFTAAALGLPAETVDPPPDRPPELPSFLAVRGADGLHRA
ncbi:MAG: NUDIX hydrolase, partial [Natronosporangium sp.]